MRSTVEQVVSPGFDRTPFHRETHRSVWPTTSPRQSARSTVEQVCFSVSDALPFHRETDYSALHRTPLTGPPIRTPNPERHETSDIAPNQAKGRGVTPPKPRFLHPFPRPPQVEQTTPSPPIPNQKHTLNALADSSTVSLPTPRRECAPENAPEPSRSHPGIALRSPTAAAPPVPTTSPSPG